MNVLEIDLINQPFERVWRLLKMITGKQQCEIFRTIADEKEWRIIDIAEKTGIKHGNLSAIITQMEKHGLIIKKQVKIRGNMKIIKPIYDEIVIKLRGKKEQ